MDWKELADQQLQRELMENQKALAESNLQERQRELFRQRKLHFNQEIRRFLTLMHQAGNPGIRKLLDSSTSTKISELTHSFYNNHPTALMTMGEGFNLKRARRLAKTQYRPGWITQPVATEVNDMGASSYHLAILVDGTIAEGDPQNFKLTLREELVGVHRIWPLRDHVVELSTPLSLANALVAVLRKNNVRIE